MDELDRRERQALGEGRAFTAPSAPHAWALRGADALDLLQRLSASELSALSPDELRPALFCDERGRLVALTLLQARADGVLAICAGEQGRTLRAWVERFLIMEDASFEDLPELRVIRVLGDSSPSPEARCFATPAQFGATHLLVCSSADEAASSVASLVEEGYVPVREESARLWRLKRGLAYPGLGLDDHFHPLEVGLTDFVSTDKGCYVGQEVLARLANYDKVRRGLAILHGEGTAPSAHEDLYFDSKVVGRVIDAMQDGVEYVALATVERSCPDGTELRPESTAAGTLTRVPAA